MDCVLDYDELDHLLSEVVMPRRHSLDLTDTFATSTDYSLPDASKNSHYTLLDTSTCTEDLTLTGALLAEDIRCRNEKSNIASLYFLQSNCYTGYNVTGKGTNQEAFRPKILSSKGKSQGNTIRMRNHLW